jgi:hypothetical protein
MRPRASESVSAPAKPPGVDGSAAAGAGPVPSGAPSGGPCVGIGAEAVRGVARGCARGHLRALTGDDLHGPPADTAPEGIVGELDSGNAAWQPGRVLGLDPGQHQSALALREVKCDVARRAERHRAPVGGEAESRRDLTEHLVEQGRALGSGERPVPVRVVALDLLEARDLGLVEDVGDPRLTLVDPHLDELVGREVPQRVRAGAGRPEQGEAGDERNERGAESAPGAHRSPSSARWARGP